MAKKSGGGNPSSGKSGSGKSSNSKSGSSTSGRSTSGSNKSGGKSQPPLSPRPQKAPPNTKTDARRALEERSAGPLAALHRMPRWVIPVIMGVLMLLGLFIEAAWAGIFFVLVAAFLGWLLALSWPVITQGSKMFRLLVILVVGGVGIMRLMGIS